MVCKIESKHGLLVTFVRKLLCSTLILKLSPVVNTPGEYSNMSESDQKDLEGLYKICHNFLTIDPNYTEQKSCRS